MHSTAFDVAVVGGGIAGAAATIALHQAGFSVAWVRSPFESMSQKVGESLAPAAHPILAELGLSHLLESSEHRASNATFSAWGQGALIERNSAIHLEGAGYIVNRVKLEADLYELATKGANLVIETKLKQVSNYNGIWSLESFACDKQESLNVRFMIDATGRSQTLGKILSRLNATTLENDDHLVCAYVFLQQCHDSMVTPTPATLIESVESGWWYASLLPDGDLCLNYYSDSDLMPRDINHSLSAWHALLAQTQHISYWLKDAEFDTNALPTLTSATTRWLTPAAGIIENAGWMAIGDAAVSFDPLSAHGMTTALWAAAQTPNIVDAYLSEYNERLQQYADVVEQGRKNYLIQRQVMYSRERRFQHHPFWQRRR